MRDVHIECSQKREKVKTRYKLNAQKSSIGIIAFWGDLRL